MRPRTTASPIRRIGNAVRDGWRESSRRELLPVSGSVQRRESEQLSVGLFRRCPQLEALLPAILDRAFNGGRGYGETLGYEHRAIYSRGNGASHRLRDD